MQFFPVHHDAQWVRCTDQRDSTAAEQALLLWGRSIEYDWCISIPEKKTKNDRIFRVYDFVDTQGHRLAALCAALPEPLALKPCITNETVRGLAASPKVEKTPAANFIAKLQPCSFLSSFSGWKFWFQLYATKYEISTVSKSNTTRLKPQVNYNRGKV